MFGINWKGKVGGVGMMLMGAAGVLSGLGCVVNSLISDTGAPPTECLSQAAEGAALFALGLAAFGIRDAMGESKKNG